MVKTMYETLFVSKTVRFHPLIISPAKLVSVVATSLLLWTGCLFSPTAPNPQPVSASISVSSSLLDLGIGESVTMTALVLDKNQLPIEGAPLNWSSSDPTIVSVNNQGVLTALSFGRVNITVKSGTSEAVIVVIVSKDRAALVTIYNALKGRVWKNSTNWLSSFPLGAWHGVTVNPDGRVTGLNLGNNGLSGELPAALGDLDELRSLYLGVNTIRGNIPGSVGQLRNLEFLWLSNANLSGVIPSSLGNLSKLQELSLERNRLSGPIPSPLGKLVNLEKLRLNDNLLHGDIPESLGQLANLVVLSLGSNRLTGSIPPELGNLPSLRLMNLQYNGLNGKIPPALGNLAGLEDLNLSSNQLSGSIPPELGRLGILQDLRLNDNMQLMGSLPLELTQLTRLEWLDLRGTGLCAPTHPDFLAWLEMVRRGLSNTLQGVVFCSGT